jgi:HEAT repeats
VTLSPTDADLRRRAAVVAGHSGDLVGASVAANDHDPTVRAAGLGALARLGKIGTAELVSALIDSELIVRRRALELAATFDSPTLEGRTTIDNAVLAVLLSDRDDETEIAAWCLGERLQAADDPDDPDDPDDQGDPGNPNTDAVAGGGGGETIESPHMRSIVDALSQVTTSHSEALCREAAVAALGSIGHEAGLPAILVAVTDKATVRRRAVVALAPFDGPEVHQALVTARVDRDWQVRQAAEDLLRLET